MPPAVPKPAYQERYRIHAYVRQGAIYKRDSVQGRVTFAWVYQNRPKSCRFAIVSVWDRSTRSWLYEALDMYGVQKLNDELITPVPRLTHHDLDAALMATLLLYDKEVTACAKPST